MTDGIKTNILPVKHIAFVLQRLEEQRSKGAFCDAILIVEGEKFPVHRSFLAANSEYFHALFTSAEEQQNFVLAGVPKQGFRVLLDFMYTSTFLLDVSNVHDVYKASSALDFKHVQAACEKVYRKIKRRERNTMPNRLRAAGIVDMSRRYPSGVGGATVNNEGNNSRRLSSSPSPPLNDSPPLRVFLNSENLADLAKATFSSEPVGYDESASPEWSYGGGRASDTSSPDPSTANGDVHEDNKRRNESERLQRDLAPPNQLQLKRKIKSELETYSSSLFLKENRSAYSPKKYKMDSHSPEITKRFDDAGKNNEHPQTNGLTNLSSPTSLVESDTVSSSEESSINSLNSRLEGMLNEKEKVLYGSNFPHSRQQDSCFIRVDNEAIFTHNRTTCQMLKPRFSLLISQPTNDKNSSNSLASSAQNSLSKTIKDSIVNSVTSKDCNCTFVSSAGCSVAESKESNRSSSDTTQANIAADLRVISSETGQIKGHRNRRKMLKTTKVCTNIE